MIEGRGRRRPEHCPIDRQGPREADQKLVGGEREGGREGGRVGREGERRGIPNGGLRLDSNSACGGSANKRRVGSPMSASVMYFSPFYKELDEDEN